MEFFTILTENQRDELRREGKVEYLYNTEIDKEAHEWLKITMIRRGFSKPAESILPFTVFPITQINQTWPYVRLEHMEPKMVRVDFEIPSLALASKVMFFDSAKWAKAVHGEPCYESIAEEKEMAIRYATMTPNDRRTYRFESWSRCIPTKSLKPENEVTLAFCWTIHEAWVKKETEYKPRIITCPID